MVLRRFIIYALACLGLVFLDDPARLLTTVLGEEFDFQSYKIFRPPYWYHRLVTLTFRTPRPHAVTVLTLTENGAAGPVTRLIRNKCDQRDFLGKLILGIAPFHPRAIVVDRYYLPETCPTDEDRAKTQRFVDAIKTVNPQVPVILGIRTFIQDQLTVSNPGLIDRLHRAKV